MQLPSMIKGWFNTKNSKELNQADIVSFSPELLIAQFARTQNNIYLTHLIEKYNLSLFHYLLSQANTHIAEDVLQNTWLKVINKAHTFDVNSSAKNWLFTIARNNLIDELRKNNRYDFQTIEENYIASIQLSNEYEKADLLTRFNQIIKHLPFVQREAFILQQEGFSLADIAQMTATSTETIKSRLRYAKQTIKQTLEH